MSGCVSVAPPSISRVSDVRAAVPSIDRLRRLWLECALVFLAFGLLYLSLRSHELNAVDGPTRAFGVYHRNSVYFHGNNHILYPVYTLSWTRILSALGFSSSGPIEFVSLAQAMNSMAAAGILAMLFGLSRLLIGPLLPSILLTVGFGTTRAFFLHATNSAEPVVGLFWSVLALFLLVISLRFEIPWVPFVSGVLLALAMASYQSMVFMMIPCLVLATSWQGNDLFFIRRVQLKPTIALLAGFWSSFLLIYATLHFLQGARNPSQMVSMLLTVEAGKVYGGLKVAKFANLPSGFLNNIVPILPPDYTGMKSLFRLHHHDGWLVLWIGCTLAVVSLLSIITGKAIRSRELLSHRSVVVVATCLSGILIGVALLAYWDPLYDKLWLLPFLLLYMVVTVYLANMHDSRMLASAVFVLVLSVAAYNTRQAIRASQGGWPYVDSAQQVASTIAQNDLFVGDWDPISVLYGTMYGSEDQVISFPARASASGAAAALTYLDQRIAETIHRNGSVYFLGVLDEKESQWNAYLGTRCGVPYSAFNRFRDHSSVVLTLPGRSGHVTLRRLNNEPLR